MMFYLKSINQQVGVVSTLLSSIKITFSALICLVLVSCEKSESIHAELTADIVLNFIQEWNINEVSVVPNPRHFGILNDTSLVIVDQSTRLITHFSSDSEFIQKFGGKGRGPGEYAGLDAVAINPNGYIGIADMANARLTITNIHTGHLLFFDFESGWNNQLFWVKDQLIMTNAPFRSGSRDSVVITMQYFDYAANTTTEIHSFNIPTNPNPSEFTWCIYCKHTLTDNMSYVVAPPDTTYKVVISEFKSSEMRILTRSGAPLVELTLEEKERVRVQRDRLSSMTGAPPMRSEIPQFRNRINNLFVDHRDRIWVSIEVSENEPALFDVFSTSGAYMGSVRLPDTSYELVYSKNDILLFSTGYTDETGWTGRAYRISD